MGHEHLLRRFARAYRAISAVASQPFEGTLGGAPAGKLWAARFGDRLVVVNLDAKPATVHLEAPWKLRSGMRIVEAGTGATLFTARQGGQADVKADLLMDGFDLAVLYAR